jgi:hypothetical protein
MEHRLPMEGSESSKLRSKCKPNSWQFGGIRPKRGVDTSIIMRYWSATQSFIPVFRFA